MALSASPLTPQSRLSDAKVNAFEDTKAKNENLKEDPQSSEDESMSTEETQTILKSEPLSPKNGTPIQITDHRPSMKAETDRRMVAARTEPLTPNPASKKQRVSKRGSDSSSDSDSDSDRSSCSSRSSSSSSSSSSSCSHSRSGSSSHHLHLVLQHLHPPLHRPHHHRRRHHHRLKRVIVMKRRHKNVVCV